MDRQKQETFTEQVLTFLEERKTMRFTVDLEIGNVGMRRYDSIRAAIKEALTPARLAPNVRNTNTPHDGDSGKIMDVNGNCVGTWQVLPATKPPRLFI